MTKIGYKHREETKEKIRQKALDRDKWIEYYQNRMKGVS